MNPTVFTVRWAERELSSASGPWPFGTVVEDGWGWLTEGWELLIGLPGPALRFSPGYHMAGFQPFSMEQEFFLGGYEKNHPGRFMVTMRTLYLGLIPINILVLWTSGCRGLVLSLGPAGGGWCNI